MAEELSRNHRAALEAALLDLDAAATPTRSEVFMSCGAHAADLRDAIRALMDTRTAPAGGQEPPSVEGRGEEDMASRGCGSDHSGSRDEPAVGATAALADVASERRRQIEAEGWTPEHDDRGSGLVQAARAYLTSALGWRDQARQDWPSHWDPEMFKPKERRRDLVRAAALILADIERLDRAPPRSNGGAA